MSTRRLTIKSEQKDGPTIGMRLFDLLRLVLSRRRLIVGTTLAAAIVTAAVVLLIPNEYTSVATILPTGKSDKMAELKALAGLTTSMSSDANSSDLFPSVLQSQVVRDAVLKRSYTFDHDGNPLRTKLSDYYDLTNRDKLRAELANNTRVNKDRKTGLITLAFKSKYPELSQQVVTAYLDELETFNLYKRRSNGKENAAYLKQQVTSKREELATAEQALEAFQKVNRDWPTTTNPEILASLARLQREAEVKNQTYLYLTREYEIAKFEAQKDVPIVSILDHPSLPALKSYPKRAMSVVLVTFVAFIAALALVMAGEVFRQIARGKEQDSYERLREELSEDFPRLHQAVEKLNQRRAPSSVS
jgi:uncharacterized protein involved in exopolysaccharide biosynthesis